MGQQVKISGELCARVERAMGTSPVDVGGLAERLLSAHCDAIEADARAQQAAEDRANRARQTQEAREAEGRRAYLERKTQASTALPERCGYDALVVAVLKGRTLSELLHEYQRELLSDPIAKVSPYERLTGRRAQAANYSGQELRCTIECTNGVIEEGWARAKKLNMTLGALFGGWFIACIARDKALLQAERPGDWSLVWAHHKRLRAASDAGYADWASEPDVTPEAVMRYQELVAPSPIRLRPHPQQKPAAAPVDRAAEKRREANQRAVAAQKAAAQREKAAEAEAIERLTRPVRA